MFVFSLGPGFFAYLNISISRGLGFAIAFILGISLSDILLVSTIVLGFSWLLDHFLARIILGSAGVIMLTGYGIFLLLNPGKVKAKAVGHDKSEKGWHWFARGFLINGLNPNILVFWVGVISSISARYQNATPSINYFMVGTLLTVLTADLTKALMARRLKHYLTDQIIRIMNIVVGIIMIGFGISIGIYIVTNLLIPESVVGS